VVVSGRALESLMSNPQTPPEPDWLRSVDRKPEPALLSLISGVVAVMVLLLVMWAAGHVPVGPEVAGSLVFGIATFVGVLWYWVGDRSAFREGESARLLVLVVGGAIGLGLALATVCRIVIWWEFLTEGLEAWQGKEGWRLWVEVGMGVSACAIMFASMQMARTHEQSNPMLRRVFFGYNTVLTGLLLIIILILVNLLFYNYVPNISDYTSNKIYTLTPKSQQILKGLTTPVTVVALVDSMNSPATHEIQNLAENCMRVSNQIHFSFILRDKYRPAVQKIVHNYKIVSDLGLLVIYGKELVIDREEDVPNTITEFIKTEDLFGSKASASGDAFDFKGEDRLMTAISFLDQEKKRPVLYFTQNNGELDIGFSTQRSLPDKRKAAVLKQRLEKANYEVKGLRLTSSPLEQGDTAIETSATVPENAAAVVILSPTLQFAEDTLKALDAYMNPADPNKKKGKLIVMLDVDIDLTKPERPMRETGINSFLQAYGVEISKERIISFSDRQQSNARRVYAIGNPEARATNPVAAALSEELVELEDARPVKATPIAPNRMGTPPYQSDSLLITVSTNFSPFMWVESDLSRDPDVLVAEIRKDHNKGEKKGITRVPIPVAVAVTDAGVPDPSDPHAAFKPPPPGTPRLLAFGNAAFVSDAALQGRPGQERGAGYPNYDVFESSLSWLRERPQSIGLDPKDRKLYQMDKDTYLVRMYLLPVAVMGIVIVGLGTGVWVVRRR
jgi:hypothetical protein